MEAKPLAAAAFAARKGQPVFVFVCGTRRP
uniref:Uncharacterized protein n=1 Tax=Anguilla anguilla TaxID=7936 RepID=A0A0E9TTJ3_ANGAN